MTTCGERMQIDDTPTLTCFASTVYRYEEDATLSHGLRFTGENEQKGKTSRCNSLTYHISDIVLKGAVAVEMGQ